MILIRFFLFLFFVTFYENFLTCANKNEENPANELSKIVFDLSNFTQIDYIINKSNVEPFNYKVEPKQGKVISEVKLNGITVWKTPETWCVENIVIETYESAPVNYIVKVKDPNNVVTLMHFKYTSKIKQIGVLNYTHSTNNALFANYIDNYQNFNLASPFDLKYHVVKEEKSEDGTLKNITIKPISGLFLSVYDGTNLVHNDEVLLVESLILSKVNDEDKLILLNLINSEKEKSIKWMVKDGESWVSKEMEEYQDAYATNNFASATNASEEVPGLEVNELDLLSNVKLPEERVKRFQYATIPTINNLFKKLEKLSEGEIEIIKTPIFNPAVYIHRGNESWEYIEIIHTNSENDLSSKINSYYVKNENKWDNVNQIEFFSKIKEQILANLTNLKAPEDQVQKITAFDLKDNIERTVSDKLPFAAIATETVKKEDKINKELNGTGSNNGNNLEGGNIPEKNKNPKENEVEKSGFYTNSILLLLLVSVLNY